MRSPSAMTDQELIQSTKYHYGVMMNLQLQGKDLRNKELKEVSMIWESCVLELQSRNIPLGECAVEVE